MRQDPKNAPSRNDQLVAIVRDIRLSGPTTLPNKTLSSNLINAVDSLCHVFRSRHVPRVKGYLTKFLLKFDNLLGVTEQRVV